MRTAGIRAGAGPTGGRLLKCLQGSTGEITSVGFSADGTQVAAGSTDSAVYIWDSGVRLLLSGHQKRGRGAGVRQAQGCGAVGVL